MSYMAMILGKQDISLFIGLCPLESGVMGSVQTRCVMYCCKEMEMCRGHRGDM